MKWNNETFTQINYFWNILQKMQISWVRDHSKSKTQIVATGNRKWADSISVGCVGTTSRMHPIVLSQATIFFPKAVYRGQESCRSGAVTVLKVRLLSRSARNFCTGTSMPVVGCCGYACATTTRLQSKQHRCERHSTWEQTERGPYW